MYKWILSFFLGTISLCLFKTLPDINTYLLILPAIVLLVISLLSKKQKQLCLCLLAFFLGFTNIYIDAIHIKTLSKNLINKKSVIEGFVISIPKTNLHERRTQFFLRLTKMNNKTNHTKIKLSWYGKHFKIRPGEKLRLSVKLKPPHSNMNPAGFDYQRYLFAKKISATGYVKNRKTNKIIGYSSKKYAIIIFRTHLIQKILNALGKSKFTGLIIALLVGSRNYIPADQLNTFQNTGVIHLIAISGLHISLIMGFSYLLTILIVKKIYFITSKRSAFDIACIISLIFGFIYSMIAGFPLSTQRAFIMISVFMLASLMRRNIKPFHGFLLALFIVLIINPLSILSTGFWLSFCAVFILIYSFYRRDKITFFKKWIKPQIAIAIGLMPILLISFNQISTVSLIANTIAIPVFSFMVIPLVLIGGFLLIFSSFGKYILILANKVITSIWPILHWLAKKHFALWHHSAQNHLTLIFSIIGTLFILAPRFPGKWLGIICLLPLIFFKSVIKPNTLYFTLLDVGQGLSAVIKTAHHTLLYDTGIKFNENSNSGKSIIIPYLTKMGINKIDVLVISHGDNDHIGGAKSVLSSIKVNQILTSVPNKFSQKNTNLVKPQVEYYAPGQQQVSSVYDEQDFYYQEEEKKSGDTFFGEWQDYTALHKEFRQKKNLQKTGGIGKIENIEEQRTSPATAQFVQCLIDELKQLKLSNCNNQNGELGLVQIIGRYSSMVGCSISHNNYTRKYTFKFERGYAYMDDQHKSTAGVKPFIGRIIQILDGRY